MKNIIKAFFFIKDVDFSQRMPPVQYIAILVSLFFTSSLNCFTQSGNSLNELVLGSMAFLNLPIFVSMHFVYQLLLHLDRKLIHSNFLASHNHLIKLLDLLKGHQLYYFLLYSYFHSVKRHFICFRKFDFKFLKSFVTF